MNKKLVVIGIILVFLLVGLSGCNEIINDDDKFLRKAEAIAEEMYPISSYNIYRKGDKASEYRLEIADYTLSSRCEEIRDDLDFALSNIDFYYTQMLGEYSSELDWSATVNLINTCLEIVLDDIEGITQ